MVMIPEDVEMFRPYYHAHGPNGHGAGFGGFVTDRAWVYYATWLDGDGGLLEGGAGWDW